jgi:hypothetical protein
MGMVMIKCSSKYGARDFDWDTEQNTNDLPSTL